MHDYKSYLSHVGELYDDAGSLLWRCFAEHHALDPLRQAVKQSNRPLQLDVVLERCSHGVVLEIAELFHEQSNAD